MTYDPTQPVPPSTAEANLAAFAESRRAASLVPFLQGTEPIVEVGSAAVIGAGTMGSGIALALLAAGIRVVLIDSSDEALQRGAGHIARTLESSVKRGRLTQDDADHRIALLTTSTDYAAIAAADLVIEAVFENLDVKRAVFGRIDAVARRDAILATNTSFLDVDAIADATARPGSVVGLHFFSPANVMPLLEIVQGRSTSPAVLASAFALAGKIGKTGVLSKVCHGFIANRMMVPRGEQAEALALEGTPIAAIDGAMRDFGFPMGHFQMLDMAGLDIAASGAPGPSVTHELVALGRLGQKSGGGYYDYDDQRQASPSAVTADVVARFAAERGIARHEPAATGEIVDRMLLAVVAEAARILGEGVALRASDIDVAAILGYGWPAARGGPMRWAEQRGLASVVERLDSLAARYGEVFSPAPILRDAAMRGAF